MPIPHPTSYDKVPYPASAYPQSHPDRLATLAKLFHRHPMGRRNGDMLPEYMRIGGLLKRKGR